MTLRGKSNCENIKEKKVIGDRLSHVILCFI